MKRAISLTTLVVMISLLIAGRAASHSEEAVAARAAVTKSLVLLQSLGSRFIEESGCVSCHNNSLPAMAAAIARERGIKVNEQALQEEKEKIRGLWNARREKILQGDSFPGGIDTASYVLIGLAASGQQSDKTTDAIVHYLIGRQTGAGNWEIGLKSRPPLEASDFNVTALSLRAIQLYAPKGRSEEVNRRLAGARRWLESAAPKTSEDRAFHLFGLAWSNADKKVIQKAANQLKAEQRGDGGWVQIPTMESDAFATGQALVALHRAGGLPVNDPAYQQGVRYLLKTWKPDGSWYVRSRSFPFQKQFESGFPYGKDQWISAAATSWAVMALALTLEPPEPSGQRVGMRSPL